MDSHFKTFTKLLRLRRDNSPAPAAAADELSLHNKEIELLLAKIFAGLSAIKAAYAQLQLAQAPYDPNAIQSADSTIVTEFKQLSALKQSFFNRAELCQTSKKSAQVQEQLNLLKTYKITTAKLESELRNKESEVVYLQSELRVAERRCRALEARLRPGRTLAALDELHLSGLNPTHFLTLLRYSVKSIRSFVKIMTQKMESAGWDLDAAAGAIQPDLCSLLNSKNRVFAFESYVSRIMFSDFQNPDFGLGGPVYDRRRFFAEFSEVKLVKPANFDEKSQFGNFCARIYSSLVHRKMQASFFSDKAIETEDFFKCFAEMARRVWLLHCLFFSFEAEDKNSIFEVKKGCRFSEVYMESVAEEFGGDFCPAVGFTVVPGFKVGKTVIQCRVYLIANGGRS